MKSMFISSPLLSGQASFVLFPGTWSDNDDLGVKIGRKRKGKELDPLLPEAVDEQSEDGVKAAKIGASRLFCEEL